MKKTIIFLLISLSFAFKPAENRQLGLPSTDDINSALKQALQTATGNATSFLSAPGGYLDHPEYKIPLPPDMAKAESKIRTMGMGKQVDDLIIKINRAAEDGAGKAVPIFGKAITNMTLTDGKNILTGGNNSATLYFKNATYTSLYALFAPVIKSALDKYNAPQLYSEITTGYNKVPFVKPIQTDLVRYATEKALDGLFNRLGLEEKSIRDNPALRTSDLMKQVFGWADTQK